MGHDLGRSVERRSAHDEPTAAVTARDHLSREVMGLPYADQVARLTPSRPLGAPVQARSERAGAEPGEVKAAAARGLDAPETSLPHAQAIQHAFGPVDLGGVRAHVGGAGAEAGRAMGAQAYTTGRDVVFANQPDLHTAAHEVAHVVQQRAGVSVPGGVGQAGDAYEQHADAVADRVVQGRSAYPLLSGLEHASTASAVQRKVEAVQREETTEPPMAVQITLLNGQTGWYVKGMSNAADPNLEADALLYEQAFGRLALTNPVAHQSAADLSQECLNLAQCYAQTFAHVAEGVDAKAAQEEKYQQAVADMCGTAPGPRTIGIAGAIGNDPTTLLEAVKAGTAGNIRVQMTVLYNFTASFGDILAKEKSSTLFDLFTTQLADRDQTALGLKLMETRERFDVDMGKFQVAHAEWVKAKAAHEKSEGEKATAQTGYVPVKFATPEPRSPRGKLISETKKGAVGGQASARGDTAEKDNAGVRAKSEMGSQIKIDEAGLQLTREEIWFMFKEELVAKGITELGTNTAEQLIQTLGDENVKWAEGMRKWLINETDSWVQSVRESSVPIKAGPSGTTDRIMQAQQLLGVSDPLSTRAAAIAYILPINAHSLVEVLEAAGMYSPCQRPPLTSAMYAKIEPFGAEISQLADANVPSEAFWEWVTQPTKPK